MQARAFRWQEGLPSRFDARGRVLLCQIRRAKELRTWKKITAYAEKSSANGWRCLPTSDKPQNKLWHSQKRHRSKASFPAAGAIRIINFAGIRKKKSWVGSRLAPEGRDAP
jgi:hypothetical protein